MSKPMSKIGPQRKAYRRALKALRETMRTEDEVSHACQLLLLTWIAGFRGPNAAETVADNLALFLASTALMNEDAPRAVGGNNLPADALLRAVAAKLPDSVNWYRARARKPGVVNIADYRNPNGD